jgi:putative DNA primase/helicase
MSIGYGRDGAVLVRCHAGCEQAKVISALRARGLWPDNGRHPAPAFLAPPRKPQEHSSYRDDERRRDAALSIWDASSPASGTPVENYFSSRGISLPVPDTIRFHPALRHPAAGLLPAMVALVTDGNGGKPLAIHRTYLNRDGTAKAIINPPKMMLGSCGGAAVWLGTPDGRCIVGEGIETTLSAMQLWGLPGCAALSAGGMERLSMKDLPLRVLIAADADKVGIGSAMALELRLRALGKSAQVFRPQAPFNDFNDVIQARARIEAFHV